ncbi:Beta-1,4-galactosyltransferase 3, partial [Cichlidogyrus casuarinus]
MRHYLRTRSISYHIYVIEQDHKDELNRGALKNIGFIEARTDRAYGCYVFHDVDLLPADDTDISYRCDPEVPLHISSSVDTLRYELPYLDIFGGVVALTEAMMEKTGGYPNRYFGWGGEDDDLGARVRKFYGPRIKHLPLAVGKYNMQEHPSERIPEDLSVQKKVDNWEEYHKQDTFRNLRYQIIQKEVSS